MYDRSWQTHLVTFDFLYWQFYRRIFLYIRFHLSDLLTRSLCAGLLPVPGATAVGERERNRDKERRESSSDLGQILEKGNSDIYNTWSEVECSYMIIIFQLMIIQETLFSVCSQFLNISHFNIMNFDGALLHYTSKRSKIILLTRISLR